MFCTCPFDWEPVCKHVVSVLAAYAAQQPVQGEDLRSASVEAHEERIRAGRTQVRVEHLSGAPALGTWRARSINATGGIAREYRVLVRSRDERINHCECRDFAYNQLGTCKHIEAVLHVLTKQRRGKKARGRRGEAEDTPTPPPVVHLAWDVPDAPRVRLWRPDAPDALEPGLGELLDRHFDRQGFLRGELPDALFVLERGVRGRFEVEIGDDALDHARRLAERAVQRERAQRVREEIARSGGQLEGVHARLFPYQVEGVGFLASRGRAILADDMGLGKTIQAIAASVWLRRQRGVERVIVICPASLKQQWAREIARFTGM